MRDFYKATKMYKTLYPNFPFSYTSRLDALGANAVQQPGNQMNFDDDSDFIIKDIRFGSTNRPTGFTELTCRLVNSSGENWDNVESPLALGFSNGLLHTNENGLKILQESIIPASSRITAFFTNNSVTALQNVEITFIGYKVPAAVKSFIRQPFCYLSRLATLPALQTLNGSTININNSTDFVLTDLRMTELPGLRVQLTSSDTNFSNIAQSPTVVIGAGLGGFKNLENCVIPSKSQFNVQFTNLGALDLNLLEVQMWGYKIPRGSIPGDLV